MLIEVFEQAAFSSTDSDLDMLLEYALETLRKNGARIKRYDKLAEPEQFERVEGYALPVIMADGEIISAGAYDLRMLEKSALTSKGPAGAGCAGCASRGTCSATGCNSCPSKGICGKI